MTEEEYQIFSTTDEKYYCPQCRKDKLNLDSVIPDEVNGINWRKLRVGDQVDVFDTRGMRCAAEITERADISYDPLQSTFSIHYIGWSSKFDGTFSCFQNFFVISFTLETITLAQAFKRMFKHEEDALTDRSQYSRRISSVRAIPEGVWGENVFFFEMVYFFLFFFYWPDCHPRGASVYQGHGVAQVDGVTQGTDALGEEGNATDASLVVPGRANGWAYTASSAHPAAGGLHQCRQDHPYAPSLCRSPCLSAV